MVWPTNGCKRMAADQVKKSVRSAAVLVHVILRVCGLTWLCLLMGVSAPAQAVDLTDLGRAIPVTRYAQTLEDRTGSMTLDEVRASTDWRTPEREAFNFGLSRSVWWVRLSLRNATDQAQSLVLNLGTTQQDVVSWYVLDAMSGQQISQGAIGDFLDFRDRPIATRVLAVPVPMVAQAEQEVYLRLESRGTAFAIMQLSVATERSFVSGEDFKDLLAGLFYGVVTTSAVLGALIFLATAWPPAGFFALFMAAFAVRAASGWGSDMQHLIPHSPVLRQYIMVVSGMLAFVSGNAAAMSVVQVHKHVSKRSVFVMLSLTGTAILPIVWVALNDTKTSEWMSYVCGIALLVWGWFLLTRLAMRRLAFALPLFAMYSIMLLAVLGYSLQWFGVLPASARVVDVIQIGAIAVLLLLGVALASEVRQQVRVQNFKQARLAMVRYVAHDIRAPQSAILALLNRTGSDEVPSLVKTAIEDQVGRTVALTDAFLWLSKAESSVYRFEPVFLGDVVHEAIDLAWPIFEKKRMQVLRQGLDAEECEVRADREMLVRCIFNLLENAAKYSESGTTVTVTMARQGSRVSLSIRDQGVGMSPDFVRQAFAEYRRSKNSFGESGFGLGLAFVATVIEQHGATIDCISQPGQGSTFVLRFDTPPQAADLNPLIRSCCRVG